MADTVAVALQNLSPTQELAENLNQIRDENLQLRERLGVQSEIVGRSAVMRRIMEEIARAAPTNATVLIRGESGVGKELVARAVHFSSPRKKGPFVCLNCAALSESLLESELFGHERGAFTGATPRKIGKFEGSPPGHADARRNRRDEPHHQAKFLRVLEGHPFERVGGSEPVKVDVRVIAATNRDLEKDVAEGRFRRDLYFRLHVLEIIVPPLRKRPEDIAELAELFLPQVQRRDGPAAARLHAAGDGQLHRVSLAGQRPRAEERHRAGRRADRRRIHRPARPELSKLATAGDGRSRNRRRRSSRPFRWTKWSGGTSWPRCSPPAGTRARRPACSASNARRSTARSAAMA